MKYKKNIIDENNHIYEDIEKKKDKVIEIIEKYSNKISTKKNKFII